MSKRAADPELRREVALRFREAIQRRNLSLRVAAETLGVKRQTLWLYLNQKATPGGDVLRRACELWEISLTVKGFEFTTEAFRPARKDAPSKAEQLDMFKALEILHDAKLEAKVVGKVGDYFELRVRIRSSQESVLK